MAKRFIDTNLFSDEWFNELSKDSKLFFIYFITTCDHAGILKLNKKLCEFQTGIKSIETVIKDLGKTLITVKEGLYFMPKFLKFQYPGFPKSNVRQQEGAVTILNSYGITLEQITEYLTVGKELINSYDSGSVTEPEKKVEVKKHELDLFADKLVNIRKLTQQPTLKEWDALSLAYGMPFVKDILTEMENYKELTKKYVSVYLTCNKWCKKRKETPNLLNQSPVSKSPILQSKKEGEQ